MQKIMKFRILIGSGAVVIFLNNINFAKAGFIDNEKIERNIEYCMNISNRKPGPPNQLSDCMQIMGYVVAIHDIFLGEKICGTIGTNPVQLIEIVAKYIRINKNKINSKSPNIVYSALTGVFPCEDSSSKKPSF